MAKSNHEFIEFKLSEYFVLTAATILWLHFYSEHPDPATRNTIINKKNRKNMVSTGMSWDPRPGKLFALIQPDIPLELEKWSAVVHQDVTNVLSLRPVSNWADVNWQRDIYSPHCLVLNLAIENRERWWSSFKHQIIRVISLLPNVLFIDDACFAKRTTITPC